MNHDTVSAHSILLRQLYRRGHEQNGLLTQVQYDRPKCDSTRLHLP